jgi:hypothetical protein
MKFYCGTKGCDYKGRIAHHCDRCGGHAAFGASHCDCGWPVRQAKVRAEVPLTRHKGEPRFQPERSSLAYCTQPQALREEHCESCGHARSVHHQRPCRVCDCQLYVSCGVAS